MFEQLRRTVLNHHMPNLEILHKEQEELRNQIAHLLRCRETESSAWAGVARHIRETQEDLQGKMLALVRIAVC